MKPFAGRLESVMVTLPGSAVPEAGLNDGAGHCGGGGSLGASTPVSGAPVSGPESGPESLPGPVSVVGESNVIASWPPPSVCPPLLLPLLLPQPAIVDPPRASAAASQLTERMAKPFLLPLPPSLRVISGTPSWLVSKQVPLSRERSEPPAKLTGRHRARSQIGSRCQASACSFDDTSRAATSHRHRRAHASLAAQSPVSVPRSRPRLGRSLSPSTARRIAVVRDAV